MTPSGKRPDSTVDAGLGRRTEEAAPEELTAAAAAAGGDSVGVAKGGDRQTGRGPGGREGAAAVASEGPIDDVVADVLRGNRPPLPLSAGPAGLAAEDNVGAARASSSAAAAAAGTTGTPGGSEATTASSAVEGGSGVSAEGVGCDAPSSSWFGEAARTGPSSRPEAAWSGTPPEAAGGAPSTTSERVVVAAPPCSSRSDTRKRARGEEEGGEEEKVQGKKEKKEEEEEKKKKKKKKKTRGERGRRHEGLLRTATAAEEPGGKSGAPKSWSGRRGRGGGGRGGGDGRGDRLAVKAGAGTHGHGRDGAGLGPQGKGADGSRGEGDAYSTIVWYRTVVSCLTAAAAASP